MRRPGTDFEEGEGDATNRARAGEMIFRGPVRPFLLLAVLVVCVIVLLTPWGLEAGERTRKVILDATLNKGKSGVLGTDGIT